MGVREDIWNAVRSIADAMPDAVQTMRHGEEVGVVVQSSSHDFTNAVDYDAPAEAKRFVARTNDFPTLARGAAVTIGYSLCVVVSAKIDPVGASVTIGVSEPFEIVAGIYSGTRREDGAVRSFRHPLDILFTENGGADNYADALAPTYAESYTIAIRREDWPEESAPEVSDNINFAPNGAAVTVKVSTVAQHEGWYVLKCRTKG